MYKINSKRQITLPKAQCEQLGLQPGDYIEIFEHNGRITIIKKEQDISKGSLQHLKPKADITDEQSNQDALATP